MLKRWQHGFSLAEMAIVLLIVGILMASGLGALSSQMNNQRFKETKQMLDRANEALIGFALANNRLPCPADPALANSSASAGKESRNGAGTNAYRCTMAYGDLPWVDLGLPELDSWGRRLKYQVTTFPTGGVSSYVSDLAGRNDAGTPNCGSAAVRPCFTLGTVGKISVYSASSRDGTAVTAVKRIDDAAAIIFSEGPNGAGSGADELENRDAAADGTTPRFVQDAADANFDDLLVWLPTTTLFYRLATAERLP
jgi:prepilin-type N-terminal cleavage/methylation domain-containing protein